MVNSTNQLIISLMLRYALECAKRCRNNLKESIFAKTFHSLEVPIDTCKERKILHLVVFVLISIIVQFLFTDDLESSTISLLSSSKSAA